ncbi:MAG: S-methyl-5-thioribose-1-phosphate isomerase [Methylomonas sp.]|nr:MAG: S-methyl-5-thioribose-1-phosphate isomerase [Methylomonas sp.]PPD27980.1 MAG: S-methyl-5-thioribose-1-phosphate isomerase [Methylomonas sp.]PPD39967.1 MAG: S-methyl-5-thioribose-1-phosphate isomerase [Methylomonas sp.]PPD41053.1 MAG: S-methyl-5-thioribose-1-phosphate isomerase [Methylomonas sp.]PPD52039.1 MAG: S-methyl-5-thioribose-1-phosphate isomerase [Methylomonas sp.]
MNDKTPPPLASHSLIWSDHSLKVLDQRRLPQQMHYDEYTDAAGVAEAIASMRVRGAPAIGIAAAYGVVLSAMSHYPAADWQDRVAADMAGLAASRPTAVNLFWALDNMRAAIGSHPTDPIPALTALAQRIHSDDIAANLAMGERGADIIGDTQAVLTHCNAGALATGGYGTALGVIRSLHKRGKLAQVYAGETRPWLQGARLTVWELAQDGIPATLIADSAAAWLMKSGKIDWIVVGADRIAANGDVANKIGTYSLAVLAKQHGVKFMVAAPTSTFDFDLNSGDGIHIEERDARELLPACYLDDGSPIDAWNPVFDVTPAELITTIVTERGAIMQPGRHGVGSLAPC